LQNKEEQAEIICSIESRWKPILQKKADKSPYQRRTGRKNAAVNMEVTCCRRYYGSRKNRREIW